MPDHPIPEAVLEHPVAVVGKVGSGKTFAAKGAVEPLLAGGRRVLISDPTGVWHGLRTRSDGEPGFPVVIFGGEHADVAVQADDGRRLGELLAGDTIPQAILDTSEMSTGDRIRFLTPLFEELFRGPRVPRHLVLDEADEVAPQNPMPEGMRLLGIVDKIVRRGRVRGFRPLMITQRPAVLHKNVLSQVGTLVALALTSPQDRKAVEAWVKGNADEGQAREVLASLAKLPRGEGWVWSPAAGILERVAFPEIGTLDTSGTPDHDDADWGPREMASVDVGAIRAALAHEDTHNPGSDPAKSKRRPAAPTAEELAAAEQRGYAAGVRDGAERMDLLLKLILGPARQMLDEVQLQIDLVPRWEAERLKQRGGRVTSADAPPVEPLKRAVAPAPKTEVRQQRSKASAETPSDLPLSATKMLSVIRAHGGPLTWAEVALLAVLAPTGGSFNASRKALVDGGYVEVEDGGVRPVEQVAPRPRVDTREVLLGWREKLGGSAARIIALLTDHAPASRTWPEIAGELSLAPTGGSWNSARKQLRTNSIVVERDGGVILNPILTGRW